jgi:Uma2 family endonuclease
MAVVPKTEKTETGRLRTERMSLEEYLALPEPTFAEWVDGEVTYLSATEAHQALSQLLSGVMQFLAEEHDLGIVMTAPYAVKFDFRPSVREPDVMFVAKENADRVTMPFATGAMDIAVEIISPDSQARDRREKFAEYAKAGVREYWMVDYERQEAEFFRLNKEGVYETIPVDADGVFRSEVLPGFRIKVEWLWQKPLPKLSFVLRFLGLI